MRTRNVGLAGLRGWRDSVASAVADPVAKRSSFSRDQVRATIGGIFLLLAVLYIAGVLKDLLAEEA